jgi:hypothetical protein
MRGMTRELLSLQQLNDKIRDVETSVNNRLGAFQPTIDNLQFVWRAVTLAVVGAVVISILAIAWPTLKSVAQWLEHRVSTRLASPPTTSVSPQTTNKPQ